MKQVICVFTFVLALILTFSGCAGNSSDGEPGGQALNTVSQGSNEEAEEPSEEDHTEEKSIHLTWLQIETAGIEFGELQLLPLNQTIKTNGFLELPPQNQAKVSTVLGGIVKKIHVREGDAIKEGDVLADLADPRFSEMQADYRKTAYQIGYLEADYRRKERLADDDISSQRELQLARSGFESARAEMQSLKSKLTMLNLDVDRILEGELYESIPLKAPIGGYVRVIGTNPGQYANPGSDLFEIVDNEHIHIDLLVYEKDIHKVRVGQDVLFKYTNQPNDQFYRARIFSVGKAFEDNPRAVRVHAEIEDRPDGLLPGMFVDGRIVTGTGTSMALPEDAIIRNGVDYLVFAIHKNTEEDLMIEDQRPDAEGEKIEFEIIKVRPGTTDAGYTEIRFFRSPPENIRFVTKGAYYLLAEIKKGEGGHEH